jgi:hypothetical protein
LRACECSGVIYAQNAALVAAVKNIENIKRGSARQKLMNTASTSFTMPEFELASSADFS